MGRLSKALHLVSGAGRRFSTSCLVVSVDLDAVAVGVGHLNAHETPVVLPLRLDDARRPEAVARGADGSLVRQPEAEVVRARKLSQSSGRRDFACNAETALLSGFCGARWTLWAILEPSSTRGLGALAASPAGKRPPAKPKPPENSRRYSEVKRLLIDVLERKRRPLLPAQIRPPV